MSLQLEEQERVFYSPGTWPFGHAEVDESKVVLSVILLLLA